MRNKFFVSGFGLTVTARRRLQHIGSKNINKGDSMLQVFQNLDQSVTNFRRHNNSNAISSRKKGPTRGQAASKARKAFCKQKKQKLLAKEAKRLKISTIQLSGMLYREYIAAAKAAKIPDWMSSNSHYGGRRYSYY